MTGTALLTITNMMDVNGLDPLKQSQVWISDIVEIFRIKDLGAPLRGWDLEKEPHDGTIVIGISIGQESVDIEVVDEQIGYVVGMMVHII